ncbi:MAG: ATP-binding cassette domain-containing protein [Candidatus Omnitrophica bacterium]|nr:ATP-binding cassette domain-containing protein [Candidatus Omnitrophota bacterium]
MISIANLSKHYGHKTLFENISLTINKGEKIGLIGPNGAGKSTLFGLILNEVEPSRGEVMVNKDIHIGYLPQESHFSSQRSVLAELTEGDARIVRLLNEKETLENKNAADTMRYGDVLHELETLGYFELEHRAEKILSGLGFRETDFHRPIRELSGGWQMRVLLAKLLTCDYDLLLLDEPTNYLDLNAALWLKDYLASFRGSFIMISHDKAFLNEVTNYTLILELGKIYKVQGNYEHFEQLKAQRRTTLEKQYKEQEKKRKQLKRYVERFHAQPNKAQSVRAKRTALERLEKDAVELPPDTRESIRDFKFPQTRSSGYRVMRLEGMSKAYGENVVYRDFDFEIEKGEKAVLTGENGAGKSTLLRILAGVLPMDGGRRISGHNVDIGYFSQTRTDVLNLENTVLREAYSAAPGYAAEEAIRTILGAFLFRGDDVDKKVRVLSGGEKSRLILAKLLVNPPNFLLLDEPTTHLDVDAVDALLQALHSYEGTIVCISHDIHFVRSLANVVFEVKSGRVRKYPGSFDYYLEKRVCLPELEPVKQQERDEARQKRQLRGEEKKKAKEELKARKAEERKRKAHNQSLRQQITRLQKEQETLRLESYAKARALSDPRMYRRDDDTAREYGRRLKEIEKLIAGLDEDIRKLNEQML